MSELASQNVYQTTSIREELKAAHDEKVVISQKNAEIQFDEYCAAIRVEYDNKVFVSNK
jgi:hypothetical protein